MRVENAGVGPSALLVVVESLPVAHATVVPRILLRPP